MVIDRVLYRRWNSKHGGGVIAILPDVPANPGMTMMYESIGQHGEGCYSHVCKVSKPIRELTGDVAALHAELFTRGYSLRVMNRMGRRK
jgi:hypothetical protein